MDRMLNVVLVEDEMLVLLGMKMCIQDAGQNMKVAATFSNGEAALEFFKEHTADVLISDIRLTGMSGLELIEKIRPDHPHMLIIVLSCYEDFSYARKAFEIGVDKYILKHELVEDELAALISSMHAAKNAPKPMLDTQPRDLDREFAKESFERTDCSYFIGLVTLRGEADDPLTDDRDIRLPLVVEIIQEILNRDKLGECFLRRNEQLICIFTLEHTFSQEQITARLQNFFDNMSKNIKNYFNRYAYLTVSECFSDLSEVKRNYEAAKTRESHVFYMDTPCMLRTGSLPAVKAECPEIAFKQKNIFSDLWIAEFEADIRDFFKRQRLNGVNADELKIQVVRYVNEFSSFLTRYYDVDINHIFTEETRPNYFSINGFKNSGGLMNWLIKMVKEVREYILLHEKRETTISRILEYIEQNYSTDITLSDIAAKFHMNSVYICQLFKKKTGVTFIYYINSMRIEKAKGLLLSTDLTVEQVAEQVGIQNYNYFFRLFKKITCQTVNQYRKK